MKMNKNLKLNGLAVQNLQRLFNFPHSMESKKMHMDAALQALFLSLPTKVSCQLMRLSLIENKASTEHQIEPK